MFAAIAAAIVPFVVAAAPASGAIVINEVESDPNPDFVELYNTGAVAVDIGGYVIDDDNAGNTFTVPGGTVIPPNGFYATDPSPVALGDPDAVNLFEPANPGVPIDTFSWPDHASTSFGRCPDGTGALKATNAPTMGAANDCPADWPGSPIVGVGDDLNVFGQNLSGVAYEPGSAVPGVLYAVRNGPSSIFRLIFNGSSWTPDPANGWAGGKQLQFPGGLGVPDAEGITFAGADPNTVYVSTERNQDGVNDNVSRPAILRFDVSGAGEPLVATGDWNLTADLPGLTPNGGIEALTWVPDDVLVAKGFFDEAAVAPYNPAAYADHGSGLFFVGVEDTGQVIAYALNHTTMTATRVATITSGFAKVMALEFEPETGLLWVLCDNDCDGRITTMDVAQSGPNDGRYVVASRFSRPAGMDNLNNEGFAISPQSHCGGGLKPVYWTDDENTGFHALRGALINCTVLPPAPGGGGNTPPPGGGDPPGPGPGPGPPTGPPLPPADTTAPTVRAALKFARRGNYAVRRTGKFGLTITLGERADVTVSATARRNSRTRARTILRSTTRRNVASGKRTLTFTLSRSVRRALKKGETVTLRIRARDAAGNASRTRTVTGKVR